jgi:hypothetical protein
MHIAPAATLAHRGRQDMKREDAMGSAQKPAQTFWGLWNTSFGFFGIQLAFALQNANVSRIFQALGSKVDDLAFLWIAGPVTGLVVQPLIGHWSDRTWGRFGRGGPISWRARCWRRWRCWACPTRRCCWWRRCSCGCSMPRSTWRWSRFAPLWET